jgi:DNA-binding IclR family transcriptional regulator
MTAMQSDSIVLEDSRRTPRPGVVERLTQILDTFATGPEHLLLEDITSMTGLPRSTAFRLLTQLVELQWLEHDSRGYRLGVRVHGLGSRGSDHTDLRAAASSVLNDLHLATGAVVHLAVLAGSSVQYLDKVGGAVASSIPSRVGARLPAETTVSGRALLACLAPERVDALMALEGSRIDLADLHTVLNQIRRRHGLAYAPAEGCTMDISAVAAPILGPEGAVAALSIGARGAVRFDNVAPMVAFAARRVSQMLFPNWSGARRSGPGRAVAGRRRVRDLHPAAHA